MTTHSLYPDPPELWDYLISLTGQILGIGAIIIVILSILLLIL